MSLINELAYCEPNCSGIANVRSEGDVGSVCEVDVLFDLSVIENYISANPLSIATIYLQASTRAPNKFDPPFPDLVHFSVRHLRLPKKMPCLVLSTTRSGCESRMHAKST
jgi:hypothetical protein